MAVVGAAPVTLLSSSVRGICLLQDQFLSEEELPRAFHQLLVSEVSNHGFLTALLHPCRRHPSTAE